MRAGAARKTTLITLKRLMNLRCRVARFGNVAIGIQPARGYNIDPKSSYHSPDLVPPHGYFAFYAWLRKCFEVANAIIHHGQAWESGVVTRESACFIKGLLP